MADNFPTHYRVAVVVPKDVIEVDGQPWRVVAARSGKVVRELQLKHAQLPNRTRTIRRRLRDAAGAELRIRMLQPYVC